MRHIAAIILILFAFSASAQEEPAPEAAPEGADGTLVVGVFAPRLYFQNSLARTSYAHEVAARLSARTGLAISGRGFATRADFDGQVQKGRVQFAVVEAQLQAERGFVALGQGSAGGTRGRPMVLVVNPGAPAAIGGLKGRTLALVAVGSKDKAFVMNHLLQGQVPGDWFKTTPARDVQSALGLVKLGKADAAFTFAGSTEGLPVAFQSRPVPLPVFVQTDKTLAPDVVEKVKGALAAADAPNGVFDGFGALDAPALQRLGNDLDGGARSPETDPLFASPRSALPPVPEFLDRGLVPVAHPDPAAGMGLPPPPPDAF